MPTTPSPEVVAAVGALAALDRHPASAGARQAGALIAGHLAGAGLEARQERERVHGGYWWPLLVTSAAGAAAAALGGRRRLAGAGLGALAAACAADDLEIGRRPLRRLLPRSDAVNVVAAAGPAHAERTVVIHAHHDAARTGRVFDPRIAKAVARRAGRLIERAGATPPALWAAVAGPGLAAAGALLGRRAVRRLGGLVSAGCAAAMADIASSPAVPGANDNLSGVAVLLTLAQALREQPLRRTRVILLSTGAEEAFLSGMRRFGERHFGELDRARTTFLCVESVGSPELLLLDGEGLLRLHRYGDEPRAGLTRTAARLGVGLCPPFRYRFATDGQIPLRAGYPTAVLTSMDWYKAPSDYHWPTDRPDRLCWPSVAAAAQLVEGWLRLQDG